MFDRHVFETQTTEISSHYVAWGKRSLDILLVLLALPALLPIFAVLTLLSSMDGHNPFYCQKRVGLNGKAFCMFKFRTMVVNAEARLESYLATNPAARLEWDVKQKLSNDPRITRVGNFMRKSSMDELPQLLNVLLGDMSLIGPRPMMTSQIELYSGTAYYAMRPGLSGPWQISDRNLCSFEGRVRFDNDYYRDISLRTDCDILIKTFSTVVKGTGC